MLPRLRTNGDALDANSLHFARYLALTGASLSGLDMLASGLATHFMEDAVAGIMHKRLGVEEEGEASQTALSLRAIRLPLP